MTFRSSSRLRPFRAGLLAGLGLFALTVGGFILMDRLQPRFAIELTSRGADLDRHGAARLVLSNEQDVTFIQSCRDGCDDLWRGEESTDNAYWVRVLDAHGQCVACTTTGLYVTSGVVERLAVRGADRLEIDLNDRHIVSGDSAPAPGPALKPAT